MVACLYSKRPIHNPHNKNFRERKRFQEEQQKNRMEQDKDVHKYLGTKVVMKNNEGDLANKRKKEEGKKTGVCMDR